MNLAAKSAAQTPAFTGWDELGPKAPSWKIEREEVQLDALAPFFPDQNGGVYEQLLFNFPFMMHAMDGSGRLSSVNRQWCKTLGYLPSDVMGKSFNELLTPQSRSHLITAIYPQYLQTGLCRGEEMFVHRKDGTLATVMLSMNAYRGDKGRIERSICLLHDITDRKIAEIATARSDQRFRGAFSAAAHGMALVSPTGQIELSNAAFVAFLGRKDIDKSTLTFDETLHRDDRGQFLNGMRQLLSGEIPSLKQELRYMTGTGGVAHGSTSVSMVRSENSEIEQLVVQIVDVTDRRLTTQRLHQAQKMEAIGQLTGGLAHDFNNLLTIIMGNLQLLESKLEGDEKAVKRANEALDAARKGSDLTRQLLAFARKQDLEPQEVKVNDLVAGMEALISRTLGENVELKVDVAAGAPKVLIDPSQFESSILNLAINARDAMPNGGLLTIETQLVYLDHEYAEKHPEVVPGHHVMVAISDTGTGMTPELLEKVFHPFFTTKENGKGTGLGLSMVYGFIKQSGGHISIYSEVGHGTSVKMYLPRKIASGEISGDTTAGSQKIGDKPPRAAVAVAAEPEVPVKTARLQKILVVEDQEAVRAVACGFLTDFGYDVVEAEDGFQALSKLQEDPEIDLMFSDIVMPGGMNGFDLAQAASGMRPDLKIVHTSGYPKGAMVHQDEPRFKQGFIIMKPYRREELQKIIRDAFEKQI
ncbi:MAG: PAS domain S-box protein [Aestuariivirga sp.]